MDLFTRTGDLQPLDADNRMPDNKNEYLESFRRQFSENIDEKAIASLWQTALTSNKVSHSAQAMYLLTHLGQIPPNLKRLKGTLIGNTRWEPLQHFWYHLGMQGSLRIHDIVVTHAPKIKDNHTFQWILRQYQSGLMRNNKEIVVNFLHENKKLFLLQNMIKQHSEINDHVDQFKQSAEYLLLSLKQKHPNFYQCQNGLVRKILFFSSQEAHEEIKNGIKYGLGHRFSSN
jgi:hypothetical protein